jgi:putative tryptophan/tyrosine transport system substrate-binding protein
MKRRAFIAPLGSAAASVPRAVRAQGTAMRKVGVLLPGVESDPDSQVRITPFRDGLAQLGWKECENVQVEYRWSAGNSDLPAVSVYRPLAVEGGLMSYKRGSELL